MLLIPSMDIHPVHYIGSQAHKDAEAVALPSRRSPQKKKKKRRSPQPITVQTEFQVLWEHEGGTLDSAWGHQGRIPGGDNTS